MPGCIKGATRNNSTFCVKSGRTAGKVLMTLLLMSLLCGGNKNYFVKKRTRSLTGRKKVLLDEYFKRKPAE